MEILMIGAGNMGLAYAEGIVNSKLTGGSKLMVYDIRPEMTENLDKKTFEVYGDLKQATQKAELIFLAVKPYHAEDLMKDLKPMLQPNQIIVSIMAGLSIETLKQGLALNKIVRAMPNLPAQVGKGLTSYTASEEVSKEELVLIDKILSSTGRAIYLDTEKDVDASTGISGSGPAYVFYFMQSMMEAAQKMGFSDHDSKVLVSQTFDGAVELFNRHEISPKGWMKKVASKGGTTEAALDSMEENKVRDLIQEAAYAAFKRAVELGN